MTPSPYVPLGRVVKTHGLAGEVSVVPATDLPFVLPEGLEVWFVPPPTGVRSGRLLSVRRGPKGPLVRIDGVTDVDAASALCGREVLARAEDLPPEWSEGSQPRPEPVGLRVVDESRGELGDVVEVIETGANDVWVVHGSLGEVLIPVIDDVVLSVDEEEHLARVRLLPGLIEEEGEHS